MSLDWASLQTRLASALGEQPRKVVARSRLHACGDLFRTQFEEKVGHSAILPSMGRGTIRRMVEGVHHLLGNEEKSSFQIPGHIRGCNP